MPTLKTMIINHADLTQFSNQHLIIIPIRSFFGAKSRLSPTFDEWQRSQIMKFCADAVLNATREVSTIVVTSDPEVQSFALQHGKFVLPDPDLGLNYAISEIYHAADRYGVTHITIAHGDLPLASDLTQFAQESTMTIVPDRHMHGTNLLSIPTGYSFDFAFGKNSFKNHLLEAKAVGLHVSVIEDLNLMIDIDTTDDLATLARQSPINFFDLPDLTN